jgi:uncharacterized protein YggE
MERYIEVVGEGKFLETASHFISQITLEVRAAKDETALHEVAELRTEAIEVLRKAGISDEEFVEGGADFHRPWYWKKQVGQSAARKIILKVTDYGRLTHALELLEPLQSRNKERRTVSILMRQPEFADSVDSKATALAEAFEDAKQKALRVAAAMNCKLGQVIHLEEGGSAKRNSGFIGDEDWYGDSSRFGAAGGGAVMLAAGAAAESEPELQRPTRSIFVKCRVRFQVDST